ncbi:MAG: hypothetical protein K940chlam2_00249 [Chlamydiae bacterium]|nr:hypothetical protein [Chlamydiota bacterium]
MRIVLILILLLLIHPLFSINNVELLFPETEEEIQQWLDLGKPKGFHELPPNPPYTGPSYVIRVKHAVTSTLENQWNVQIAESAVERQAGLTRATKGPFDPTISSGYTHQWLKETQVPGFKSGRNGNFDSVELSLEKLTRLGTRFSLNGEVAREFNPSFSLDNSFNRTNQTNINFSVEQPLLRRLRYNEESVNEKVNELELVASKNELTQTMAENVRNTLRVYWELVATQRIVTINTNAKLILEALASATETLVEGERIAASELNEQFAELARNNRELIASRQDAYRLFNSLLFEMGIDRDSFSIELPHMLLDDFPLFDLVKKDWDLDYLLCLSMESRGDLLATQYRIEESQWQLRLAKQEVYPELDLRFAYDLFNSQINRRAKPFFASTETHKAQNDYSVSLNFSVPIFNNRAKGERTRRREEEVQAGLEEQRLAEDIRQSIASSFREQMELIDQIYYARKTVTWYKKALKDEIQRFKEGYGSLFIIIDFENRLRLTLIREAEILAQWSNNIVEILFQTGTLIQRDICSDQMNIDIFNYKKLLLNHESR